MPGRVSRRKPEGNGGSSHEWFQADGGPFTYRKPIYVHGKWRVHRREKEKKTKNLKLITLEIRDEEGKDITGSATLNQAKEAVRARAYTERREWEEAQKRPEERPLIPITLEDAFKKWLTAKEVRSGTRRDYESSSNLYQRQLGNAILVHQIRIDRLEAFFFAWMKDRSGRTKLKHLAALKNFYGWAIDNDYCRENLAAKIAKRIPKAWKDELKIAKEETGKPLSLDEQRRLLQECEGNPWLWLYVFLSLRTGIRRGNLLGSRDKRPLEWTDIDLERKLLKLPREIMKSNVPLEIPIADDVVEVLREYRSRFPAVAGPVIRGPRDIRRGWRSALKRAKIAYRRPHDLRVSFAVVLGELAPFNICQRLLGHAKVTVTERYSGHQGLEAMRSWANQMPRIAGQVGPGKTKAVDVASGSR